MAKGHPNWPLLVGRHSVLDELLGLVPWQTSHVAEPPHLSAWTRGRAMLSCSTWDRVPSAGDGLPSRPGRPKSSEGWLDRVHVSLCNDSQRDRQASVDFLPIEDLSHSVDGELAVLDRRLHDR